MNPAKQALIVIFFAAIRMTAQTPVTNNNDGASGTIPAYSGSASLGNSPISVSGGNVGIGTVAPAAALSISGYVAHGDLQAPQILNTYGGGDGSSSIGLGANNTVNGVIRSLQTSEIPANNASDLLFLTNNGNTLNEVVRFSSNGNVGIGTTTPDVRFDSAGVSRFELTSGTVTQSSLMNAGNVNDVVRINAPYSAMPASGSNAGAAWGIRFIGTVSTPDNRNTQLKGPAIFAVSEDPLYGYNRADGLALYTNPTDTAAVERVRISNGGNVGIGTTAPGAKLEVDGSVLLTPGSGASITFPNGTVQSTAWNGVLSGGDYAESVDVSGSRSDYEPGDVLILASDKESEVTKSTQAYSTLVAGIYATKPGALGRRRPAAEKPTATEVPMAMVGIVPTKVTTENGAIYRGDLLVSSSSSGYAMKGTDRTRMLGAVLGKAMGNLDSGTGVIDVLVTLQ